MQQLPKTLTMPIMVLSALSFWNTPVQAQKLPIPSHIVIVIEENRSYDQIIHNDQARFMNQLARQGASLRNSHGETHPSQPNYLVLFSGDDQCVRDDNSHHTFHANNLASALAAAGKKFAIYSESIPETGFLGDSAHDTNGVYRRKHNPCANFDNIPKDLNKRWQDFPSNYNELPDVAFVIPNLQHDMHDGSIAQADHWLQTKLGKYIEWAKTNNSLFILTWDEDNHHRPTHTTRKNGPKVAADNQIPTLLVGQVIQVKKDSALDQPVNHYSVLRTIEEMFGLKYVGASGDPEVNPIKDIWTLSGNGVNSQ